jgi:Polyketide cyclase / dehydrase and lipid transport
MLSFTATSAAPSDIAWDLIARPSRWSEWAPQLRGAWGLGDHEVALGARGAACLVGVVPVPAAVVAKEPGRSWTWRVGPVELDHRVEPRGTGCVVAVALRAPAPLEAVLRVTYGPVVAVLVRRLARVAERDAARRPSAS